jgi:hypothetical protein
MDTRLYTPPPAWHLRPVRFTRCILIALVPLSALPAEKAEKPVGRTAHQRFNPTLEEQQALVFDTRQGATGGGRSFNAGNARVKDFQVNQRFAASKYQTADFQTRKSWFGNFKFGTKSADTKSASAIPNVNAAAPTKTAATKELSDGGKTAAVRSLPGRDRPYLGPESKKLDRTVDPNKPLPGWTGDKMDTLTLEQIRELLNKNK